MKRLLGILFFASVCLAQSSISGTVSISGTASLGGTTIASNPVALDTSHEARSVGTGVGSYQITVASNANRALCLIFISTDNTNVIGSITDTNGDWSGAATLTSATVGTHKVDWRCLANPATGLHDLAISWSVSNTVYIDAYSLYNVNQTTPIANSVAQLNNASVAVTTVSGDYALFTYSDAAGDATVSGCTTTFDASDSSGVDYHHVTSCAASGASTSVTWSACGASCAVSGVRIKQQ